MVNIVQQSFVVRYHPSWTKEMIETVARDCYQSGDMAAPGTAEEFFQRLVVHGHDAMIEFGGDPIVRLVTNRGVSHELVRHRLASYAQESTRYCNYSKKKFGNQITVINPYPHACATDEEWSIWFEGVCACEDAYFKRLAMGVKPQMARGNLPIDLKTVINIKMNVRQWRYFFTMRDAKYAHPQMRSVAGSIRNVFMEMAPGVYDDVGGYTELMMSCGSITYDNLGIKVVVGREKLVEI